jgi:hypothetical protein
MRDTVPISQHPTGMKRSYILFTPTLCGLLVAKLVWPDGARSAATTDLVSEKLELFPKEELQNYIRDQNLLSIEATVALNGSTNSQMLLC